MLSIIIVLFIFLFGDFIITLFLGQAYVESIAVLKLQILGVIPVFIGEPARRALIIENKQNLIMRFSILAALLNLSLNFIFIPIWGTIGAAVTTVLAYILFDVICYWWAQRVWPVNHDWKGISVSLLFIAAAFVVGWQIDIMKKSASF